MNLLYNYWLCVLTIAGITYLLSALFLLRLRHRFGIYIAMACMGVAVEACVLLTTTGYFRVSDAIGYWILIARTAGRTLEAAAGVMLILYLLGYVNGNGSPKIRRGETWSD